MDDHVSHGADPERSQLDRRWRDYLSSQSARPDHAEWLVRALSDYRDEIVHYGAQLLNDCVVRPWNESAAQISYEEYRRAAREYDQDPDAWEAAFWSRVRQALPPDLREELPPGWGEQSTF